MLRDLRLLLARQGPRQYRLGLVVLAVVFAALILVAGCDPPELADCLDPSWPILDTSCADQVLR
jgi:hypothetical protein